MNLQWVADAWVGLSLLLLFGSLGAYVYDSRRFRRKGGGLPESANRLALQQQKHRGLR